MPGVSTTTRGGPSGWGARLSSISRRWLGYPLTGRTERDRKSVVWGKSVDLGGRRIIKKKNKYLIFSEIHFSGRECYGVREHESTFLEATWPRKRCQHLPDSFSSIFFFQAEDGIRDA